MRLNGKEFQLFNIDTVSTIVERIASQFSSLPKWLIFDGPLPQSVSEMKTGNFRVENFLSRILNQKTLELPRGPYPVDSESKEIQDLFVATNLELSTVDPDFRRVLFHSMKGFYRDPEDIFKDADRIKFLLKTEIEKNERRVQDFLVLASTLDSVSPVSFSPFELDHIQFSFEFDIDLSLERLFNSIETSAQVPFVVMTNEGKSVFKIFRDFRVNPDWLEIRVENALLMKVDSELEDLKPLTLPFKKFTNAAFSSENGQVFTTMDTNIGSRFLPKDKFIERTLSAVKHVKWPQAKMNDNLVVAYYSIPFQCMDPAIFSELVMNNLTFNSIVAIDESIKASKTTSSIYLHRLDSSETVNLVMKHTIKHNQFGMINIGEPYIRCRLKTTDSSLIVSLQTLVGKLFGLYNSLLDETVEEYQNVIPSFRPVKCNKKPVVAPTKLTTIVPEIFFPTYSRICAHGPKLVDPKDETAMTTTGKQILKFPIKGEVWKGVPVETRTYFCPTDKHKFVGLRENTLANKTTFPYIPCCFAQDQTEKAGSLYRKYYFDETEAKRDRKLQETVALKRRILEKNDTEVLPPNLQKLFSTLDPDPTVQYLRIGITRTKHSSVEAILLGMEQFAYKTTRATTIANKVSKEVNRMKTEAFAMAAKQELYDYSIQEILKLIESSDLRPSRFVRMLEVAFLCNIFILHSSEDDIDGSLLIPRHTKYYLKNKPSRETFLLFEHRGTDPEDYPQVELVARTKGGNFLPGDQVVENLFSFFNSMTACVINGITTVTKKIKNFPIESQSVDSFGKCRILNVKDSPVVTLVTDPIPPFAAIQLKRIHRVSSQEAHAFLIKWKLEPQWQRVVSGRLREIKIDIGTNAILLCDDSVSIPGIPINDSATGQLEGIEGIEPMKLFSLDKRSAKILLEYALKNLAEFLNGKKLTSANVERAMLAFSKDRVTMVSSRHEYVPGESEYFSNKSSFQRENKLLISSPELLRGLLFECRVIALSNPEKVASYAGKRIISGFYSSMGDFDQNGLEFILNGSDAVKNLATTFENSNNLFDFVPPQTIKRFFFKNELVSNSIHLAVQFPKLETAIAAVTLWTKRGFNNEEFDEEIKHNEASETMVDVFLFVDSNTIEKISDATKSFDGLVLAVQNPEGKPSFVALMELSKHDLENMGEIISK